MKSFIKCLIALVLATVGIGNALADRGHHGHYGHFGPRVGIGIGFGPVWSPWYYPAPLYYPPYTVVERVAPPVYVEQAAPAYGAASAPPYWYYCRAAGAYYPYVKDCATGWERVAAQPDQR